MKNAKTIIGRLISNAQRQDGDYIRSDLFDRYLAEPYGDEVKGKSGFVSSDVSDVVDSIHVDIMDVFTSSDKVLEFVPASADDEEQAKQETDAIQHIFWQKCDGFKILHDWTLEALIQQNSYVKFGWVEKNRVTIEEYEDLTRDELMQVLDQLEDNYEILESSQEKPETDPETGQPQSEEISVKIRVESSEKKYEISVIPQEEFFMTQRWPALSLTGIDCCGHRRTMERADLIAMGFSAKSIDEVGEEELDRTQTSDRWDTKAIFEADIDERDNAARKVTVYEAYVRADLEDDGKVRLYKVWAAGEGDNILEWENGDEAIEEVSHVPFVALTPHMVPHRHVGRSVSEKVTDVQKVKSVLMRHSLDNLYQTNYARPAFDENQAGPDTFSDLANPSHGAPIRTGGAMIEWIRPPSVIDTTLPIMAEMDNLKENRTGATRYSQGLDKDSLNKTMGGMAMMLTAGQKKNMLIARTFAETGMRELFLGIHRDWRNGPLKELVIKLRGKWVPINPRTWATRTDMNVNVGMGSGNRDQTRAGLDMIGNIQRELVQNGSHMVDETNIFNTVERLAETFGFKSIDSFLKNPDTSPPPPPPPPPQPDPLLISAQAQADKVKADMAVKQAEMQIKQQELQIKQQEFGLRNRQMEISHAEKMAELQVREHAEMRQQSKTASDIQTAEEKMDLDRDTAINQDDFLRDKLFADTAVRAQGPGFGDMQEQELNEPPEG